MADAMARARLSLAGLSIGDSFGYEFCWNDGYLPLRRLPDPGWRWTDDTEMALSIVSILRQHGRIEQDALAASFGKHFDPGRMYGPAMLHELLPHLKEGGDWRYAATRLFRGTGSYGNGAAMRVAPLGAFFAEDLDELVEQARRSAVVTHAHAEGIAGAIAVAVAAGRAWQLRMSTPPEQPADFLEPILTYVPESEVRRGIAAACELPKDMSTFDAAEQLGNGSRVTAQDTVPFALWSAARSLDAFAEALWSTADVLGDIDTNCAIVGGIVAMRVGSAGIPAEWFQHREPLPEWPFSDMKRVAQ